MLGPYVPNPARRERATLSHAHTRHTHEHVAGHTRVALGTHSWQDRVDAIDTVRCRTAWRCVPCRWYR